MQNISKLVKIFSKLSAFLDSSIPGTKMQKKLEKLNTKFWGRSGEIFCPYISPFLDSGCWNFWTLWGSHHHSEFHDPVPNTGVWRGDHWNKKSCFRQQVPFSNPVTEKITKDIYSVYRMLLSDKIKNFAQDTFLNFIP